MINERLMKIMQKKLRYSKEQAGLFQNNPRNADVLEKFTQLKNKRIVLQVVESNGCNSGYKPGDEFVFDAFGNLLTDQCPSKVCGYSLNAALMMVFAANEMLFAGIDPNEMRFKRASCFDVGLECGGWGRIVLECKVKDLTPQNDS